MIGRNFFRILACAMTFALLVGVMFARDSVGETPSLPRDGFLAVKDVTCRRTADGSDCAIALAGRVDHDVALHITTVADVDVATYEGREIGRTGFFLQAPFYARNIPRIYPLESLHGVRDPVITLHCTSIIGDANGIHGTAVVEIIPIGRARSIYINYIVIQITLLLLLGAVTAFSASIIRTASAVNLFGVNRSILIFFASTLLYTLSMVKLPRVLMPSLISGSQYYHAHSFIHLTMIWSLCCMLLRQPSLFKSRDWRIWVCHASYAVSLAALLSGAFPIVKDAHAFGMFNQAVVNALLAVEFFSRRAFRERLKEALPSATIVALAEALCVLVLLIDAFHYRWFHNPSSTYWGQWAGCLVLIAASYQVIEYRRSQQEASDFASFSRNRLRDSTSSTDQLQQLCRLIADQWKFARVSVVSVVGNQGLLLACAGSEAVPRDERPKPLGPAVQHVVSKLTDLHLPYPPRRNDRFPEARLDRAFIVLPIVRNDKVVAALTAMTFNRERLSPFTAAVLRLCAHSLSLEVISSMSQTLAEEKVAQLKSLATTTSGIVFENTDAWGRIRENAGSTRRIIITADGLKTTRLTENAAESELTWNAYTAYKRELYATWFSLRHQFEYLSKDVRGDDFWAISPRTFTSEFLRSLGAEKSGILMAYLIEKHARAIANKPAYALLGLTGAHVAVGAGMIRIVTLGTKESRCVDLDSPYMSRLHRIRCEAHPGSILVDLGDGGVREAGLDRTLFDLQPARIDLRPDDVFADIQRLPEVHVLLGAYPLEEITKIENRALEEAAEAIAAFEQQETVA